MADVPYRSLLDPGQRVPFTGRLALPEAPGVYAWWEIRDTTEAETSPEGTDRPLYLGAATNIAGSVEADATGRRTSALRKSLVAVLAARLRLRPRTGSNRPPLNRDENARMTEWISTHLLISWSELPQPDTYHRALTSALDPYLRPWRRVRNHPADRRRSPLLPVPASPVLWQEEPTPPTAGARRTIQPMGAGTGAGAASAQGHREEA